MRGLCTGGFNMLPEVWRADLWQLSSVHAAIIILTYIATAAVTAARGAASVGTAVAATATAIAGAAPSTTASATYVAASGV